MKNISEQRIKEIHDKIMLCDFQHCAILDPEEVIRKIGITNQDEKNLITKVVNQTNTLIS